MHSNLTNSKHFNVPHSHSVKLNHKMFNQSSLSITHRRLEQDRINYEYKWSPILLQILY